MALVQRHAEELLHENWGPAYRLHRLAEATGRAVPDLAQRLVEAAGAQGLEARAGTWLYLASRLAPRAQAGLARSALERLLDSGAARLAETVGDGPYSAALDPGADADRIVAGMVWFRLGAPEAEARWRAAHAVRALARLGRWPVIDTLFSLYDGPDAGAFQAQDLPFFLMSAQHFLLVAIARIAIAHPAEIRKHRERLEAIACDEDVSHVVLRETARRALLAAFADDASAEADALRARLAAVNVSPFALVETDGPSASAYESRPSGVPGPEPRFWFDYDFRKTDIVHLANQFGLRAWELEDRCTAWIRRFDQRIERMHDLAGRDRPHGYTREATGAGEAFQSYGAYLARHALALTAGELLRERALVRHRSSYESWDDWLADHLPSHREGLWLSDGTDTKPPVAYHHLRAGDDGPDRPCDDIAVLASLLGLGPDGTLGERVVVDGFWSSPDDVQVQILSALVPPAEADIAARALATAHPFDAWLPTAEHDVEGYPEASPPPHREFTPLEPWIVRRDGSVKVDAHDPYGPRAALGRSRPAAHVSTALGLASTDPWEREWRDPEGRILSRAEAWGRPLQGGSMWKEGLALHVPTASLEQILAALGRDLVVMVRLQLHLEGAGRHSLWESDEDIPFRHSIAVFRIGAEMRTMRIVPSVEDLAAIGRLSRRDRADYAARLAALRRKAGS
ncbi:hypothetical protein [Salinarimonas chemoclinalis]|uniref:hypothetical protein n=1 Tax=Salinarimonas chemoclinalis TaxID=3241599 RepID=UPI0035576FEF